MAVSSANNSFSTMGNAYLDSIVWGTHWETADPSDSKPTIDAFFANDYGQGWTESEKQAVEKVFDTYEQYINIDFNVVSNAESADWGLNIVNWENSGGLGMMEPPGEAEEGDGYFNWNTPSWNAGVQQGGDAFHTLIHEFGHGLGLAHPHDTGGSSTVFPEGNLSGDNGEFDLNQGVFTVMSYNTPGMFDPVTGAALDTGSATSGFGMAGTPMAFDIAALQAIYGANTTHASGNDIYTLPDGNGVGTFWSSIWDTSGIDSMEYNGVADVTIDLRDAPLTGANAGGHLSYADGIFGGFTIANGVTIENASGGAGNDNITGNDVANSLFGGAGNDMLAGGTGKDEMEGGSGADTFKFSATDTGFGFSNADIILDFTWWEGDKIDLTGTSVSYFGDKDSYSETNEVSYWWDDYDSDGDNDTIVSFNDGGVKDIILHDTIELVMMESDFIL